MNLNFNTWWNRYKNGDRMLGSRASTFRMALYFLDKSKSNNFIETGTTRKNVISHPIVTDRTADGCSTALFGDFCSIYGGHVWTCDIEKDNIESCKIATEEYKNNITYVVDDSLNFLKNFNEEIDFLYLDSVDGGSEYSHVHQLKEIELALPKVNENTVILLDDLGSKTNLSIPFLKQNGWCQILVDNYPSSHTLCQALFIYESNLYDRAYIVRK